MTKYFIFVLLMLVFSGAQAECSQESETSGAIRVTRQWSFERSSCLIELSPRNSSQLAQYRSYSFDGQGLFTVFNSYGKGTLKSLAGYREFFILPVKKYEPYYRLESNGDVTVELVSGHEFRVSARDFTVKNFEPGDVSELPVARDNNGGFEFLLRDGFWFDGGFKVANLPLSSPLAYSVVRSAKTSSAVSCRVMNQDYLTYKDKNHVIAYDTESLIDYLRLKCGQLKF